MGILIWLASFISKKWSVRVEGKKFYLYICVLGIIIVYIFLSKREWGDKPMETNIVKVCGVNAIVEHEKSDVELGYFEQLQEGVKYTDIVKEIGEPTGTIGFGLSRPYYAIQDVYIVMYFSYTGDGEYDKLLRMEVCDENEKLYELKLK